MGKRAEALDSDLPFGAFELPAIVESFRSTADRLRGDAYSRRLMSLARRACLLGRRDPIDVQIFGRCRARLYPRSNRCEKRVFLGVNSWDRDERLAVSQRLSASPAGRPFVFVDGGANVGLYSLFVASEARRLGRSVTVVAIEPDPVNLIRLDFNRTASRADEILIAPYALGEKDAVALLLSSQTNRGEVRLARAEESVDGGVEVRVRSLPNVLDELGIAYIDVLKLDIEGAEYSALSGLFAGASEAMWPSMIILEVGKSDHLSNACRLCLDKNYAVTQRTALNVILRRAGQAGFVKSQFENGR
jgi:FkbM family methyltransferase